MSDFAPPFEAFDAYVTGHMPDDEASAFEQELFASAAAGAAVEADFVNQISQIGRFLEPRGGFDIGSTRQRVDALLASGLRVQWVEPALDPAGGVAVIPRVPDDADIVITHFAIDLRGFDQIEVVVRRPGGPAFKTFRDVRCDPVDGSVYGICEAPLARISLGAGHTVSEVSGVRDGQRQTIVTFETVPASV